MSTDSKITINNLLATTPDRLIELDNQNKIDHNTYYAFKWLWRNSAVRLSGFWDDSDCTEMPTSLIVDLYNNVLNEGVQYIILLALERIREVRELDQTEKSVYYVLVQKAQRKEIG